MLAKHYRITRSEWNSMTEKALLMRGVYISLKHSTVSGFKTSVVIPKKVAKTSVLRHNLKRKIYKILENHLILKEKKAIVVYVNKQTGDFTPLEQELTDFLKKIA